MNRFPDILAEDQRLVLLRFLADVPGWAANSSVLQTALNAIGHAISRDKVHTELAWLAEQGLVKIETLPGIQVATLTERGHDVSAGLSVVPGVKRPRPGA